MMQEIIQIEVERIVEKYNIDSYKKLHKLKDMVKEIFDTVDYPHGNLISISKNYASYVGSNFNNGITISNLPFKLFQEYIAAHINNYRMNLSCKFYRFDVELLEHVKNMLSNIFDYHIELKYFTIGKEKEYILVITHSELNGCMYMSVKNDLDRLALIIPTIEKYISKFKLEESNYTYSIDNKYSVNVKWSNEDSGYIATMDAFPGLSAFGDTIDEALKEANVAYELFKEDILDEGEELPESDIKI